jgi:hypothetical protein
MRYLPLEVLAATRFRRLGKHIRRHLFHASLPLVPGLGRGTLTSNCYFPRPFPTYINVLDRVFSSDFVGCPSQGTFLKISV